MFRYLLVISACAFLPPLLHAQERKWKVNPDPCEKFKVIHKGGASVFLGKDSSKTSILIFPTTPSPYFLFLSGGKSFLLDLRTGSPVATYPQPHKGAPAILGLCPTGEYVAFGAFPFGGAGDPLMVEAYSCKTGKMLASYRPDKDTVLEWVDFGPPGRLLLSLRKQIDEKKYKRTLEIRDLAKGGALLHTINQPNYYHRQQPHVYALTPGRKYVLLPFFLKKEFHLRVHDLETGELAGETVRFAPGGTLRELAISPDGKRLAAMTLDVNNAFHVFDMTTGERTLHRPVKSGALLFDFAVAYGNITMGWAGDSTHIYVKAMNLWNVDTGELISTRGWPGTFAAAAPDGQIILRGPHGLHLMTLGK